MININSLNFVNNGKNCFNPFSDENNNDENIKLMNRYVKKIINYELTERQRQIINLYYYEQKSISEIAVCLDVNPSTVSRSLASSRKNIFRILRYYF